MLENVLFEETSLNFSRNFFKNFSIKNMNIKKQKYFFHFNIWRYAYVNMEVRKAKKGVKLKMKSNKEIMSTLQMRLGKKKYLDYEDFKDFVGGLSHSQGFYSRLYANLLEMEETDTESLEKLKKEIEKQHFTDTLQFVFWLEC